MAAASDLRPAFEELGDRFGAATGHSVRFSFGSSGQLREQILNGAPFDLFASADVEFVDEVIDAGRGRANTKAEYALGRIAMWASDPGLPRRIDELSSPVYERIAIANPAHAPYGLAARQALESAGVGAEVKPRLVYGESASDALQIAKSGNADVGIVALSLAVAERRPYTVIPADLHEPLRQALVVTSTGRGGDVAAAFARLVNSPEGREAMVRYGLLLPGEATSI